MAIERPKAIDGASQRDPTAKEELSCPARNDGNSGVPARPAAWGGGRQGMKVVTPLLRLGDRGTAGLRPDPSIDEAVWSARHDRDDLKEIVKARAA
jgi:hypothetical protein